MAKISKLQRDLVRNLKKQKFITSHSVEIAFRTIPRHVFVPKADLQKAYSDVVISVKLDEEGQSISSSSQPAIMAIMLEQLDLKPGANVLEIGAGTGYNAALMAQLVGKDGRVTTIDIDDDLVQNARTHLKDACVENVEVICADGYEGYAANAPYDNIILTVSPWDITPQWVEQLKLGGCLVVPMILTDHSGQASIKFRKQGNGLVSEKAVPCGFMHLRGKYRVAPHENTYLLADHLFLTAYKGFVVPPETVRDLLYGAYIDIDTGLDISAMNGFQSWRALYEPHGIVISAEAGALGKVPYFVGEDGRFASAPGLANHRGMGLMMRPPLTPLPEVPDFKQPFRLYIRSYGADKRPARRLIHLLKSWEAAGKPDMRQMHLRLIPLETEYTPEIGEVIVEKTWHKLIVRWQ